VEGSFRHLLTDLYAFAGTALAGLIVWTTGFERADPIASLAVAASMLLTAWPLLRRSGRVLLEGAPEGVDPEAVGHALAAHPGVVEVHDLHIWEVTSGFPALAAHVLVKPGDDCHGVRRSLQAMVGERFGIEHVTLQVDHAPAGDRLLEIETRR
jgi:cobalt-zinc-cadmium efflux system protein